MARKLAPTRVRVTQLLDILLLAPDLHAAVPAMEAVDGAWAKLMAAKSP